jgi:hypothetical protein
LLDGGRWAVVKVVSPVPVQSWISA